MLADRMRMHVVLNNEILDKIYRRRLDQHHGLLLLRSSCEFIHVTMIIDNLQRTNHVVQADFHRLFSRHIGRLYLCLLHFLCQFLCNFNSPCTIEERQLCE